MATPEQIKPHADKYKDGTWRNYTYEELAQWVNLLIKRASHRTDVRKAEKDLTDANNYMMMFTAKSEEDAFKIINSFEREE